MRRQVAERVEEWGDGREGYGGGGKEREKVGEGRKQGRQKRGKEDRLTLKEKEDGRYEEKGKLKGEVDGKGRRIGRREEGEGMRL